MKNTRLLTTSEKNELRSLLSMAGDGSYLTEEEGKAISEWNRKIDENELVIITATGNNSAY